MAEESKFRKISVDNLELDLCNPRLPKSKHNKTEQDVINYMLMEASTLELMQAIGENGFFEGEQLLVVSQNNGKYKVVEGNRRLTSVMLLNTPELARVKTKSVNQVYEDAEYKNIQELPCLVFEDENDIRKYLGYRHVTGVKSWALSEKARYLYSLYKDQFSDLPFQEACYEIAKSIGSTKNYVCRLLTAHQISLYIEDENYFGIKDLDDTNFYVGYYSDSLSRANIADFLGINLFDENPIENLNKSNVEQLTKWFYEKFTLDGKVQTRLKGKSADLNNLNRILGHEKAVKAFVEEGYTLERALRMSEDVEQIFYNSLRAALLSLENADRVTQNLSSFYGGVEEDLIQIRKITSKIKSAKDDLERKEFDDDEFGS